MGVLYEPADIKTMSPITKDLSGFLSSRGYSLREAGRADNTAINGLIIRPKFEF